MKQVPVGRSGTTISAIGLGGSPWGREIDEESSHRVLDYAFDKGFTFFDMPEGPQKGSSESIVGRWMHSRGVRDRVTICTKISQPVHGDYPWDWGRGTTKNIARALEGSLERLFTDHIDIYKMHCPDQGTPIAETLEALTEHVKAGRVEVIGCSNYTRDQLKEALDASAAGGFSRFEITQPPYSLARPRPGLIHMTREQVEEDLFPFCVKEETAVTPYSPLGAGFLSGKFTREMARDQSKIIPGTRMDVAPGHVPIYFTERNFRIVDRLRAKADVLGTPMVRLALAFAMTNPAVTAVIIGARTSQQVDQALAAYDMALDPDLRAEMHSWG